MVSAAVGSGFSLSGCLWFWNNIPSNPYCDRISSWAFLAASADEPAEMNFLRKHVLELEETGVSERAAARLFSNPPGDYGSMVNEVVGSGDWEESESLGETWTGRNSFSYGRNEGGVGTSGTARPEVLDKLLTTTERVVQEIDSVEVRAEFLS